MSIVTLDEAKQQLGITSTNSDAQLTGWIDGLVTPVENYLHEVVEQRTITEELELAGRIRFWLTSHPVISLTSLESIDGAVSYDVSNLLVRPNGRVRVIRGPRPVGILTAVYEAGYVTVPQNYKEGALVILQHLWETQRGVGGVESGVIGMEETKGRIPSTFTIPNKAKEWLGEPATLVR